VHTLVDAKWYELALIGAGYTYIASQTFGRDQAKYWQVTYRGPQGKVRHIRYQPNNEEPRPEWQLGWFVAGGSPPGTWIDFDRPVAQWPTPDLPLCAQAREQCPDGARVDARPVWLHLPVDPAVLAKSHHSEWDSADNQIKTGSQADDEALITTLEAIGFEHQGHGVYLDRLNSGQELKVMRAFDIGADGVEVSHN
jgi:hypothetical protein